MNTSEPVNRSEEIEGVSRKSCWMAVGILGQGLSNQREPIAGQGVGHDQHAMVSAIVVEELDREPNQIVPVPSHETALLSGRSVKLVGIRNTFGPDLVGADGIRSPSPEQLGDLRAEVLIQVEPQECFAAREGYRSPRRSFVQASLRPICCSISSG